MVSKGFPNVTTSGRQYNIGEKPSVILYTYIFIFTYHIVDNVICITVTVPADSRQLWVLKKNLNASRPSNHPSDKGRNVKTFRWDHRLQSQNLFMAFKLIPRW